MKNWGQLVFPFVETSNPTSVLTQFPGPLVLPMLVLLVLSLSAPAHAQGFQNQLNNRERICYELERRLASDFSLGGQANDRLPALREEIRKNDRFYNRQRARADRLNCYQNNFIFGTSLRKTRRCVAIDKNIREVRQRLERLNAQLKSVTQPGTRKTRQEDTIRALARYRCGDQYIREARRLNQQQNPFNFFGDGFFGQPQYSEPRRRTPADRLPFSTYRTLCVRECDGYYYPVSFSTFPSQFDRDANVCASRCAAPVELYVHQNPGEDVEQMVSLDGRRYENHPNAWKYRSLFVKGCSCNQAEYNPAEILKPENHQAKKPGRVRSSTKQFATSEGRESEE